MVHQQELTLTFAALADPVRRAVIARLATGDASVSELAVEHPMSLTAFLKHVHVLEDAGVVTTEKSGRTRTCRLNAPALRAAEGWLRGHRAFWERQLASLARLVEQPLMEDRSTWPSPAHPPTRSRSAARSKRRRPASSTRGPRRIS